MIHCSIILWSLVEQIESVDLVQTGLVSNEVDLQKHIISYTGTVNQNELL